MAKSLADYGGGNYMKAGDHKAKVATSELFKYNSGSDGVKFELRNDAGEKMDTSFCLVETILWRLRGFAEACGLTLDELKKYDPQKAQSHKSLVGRSVMVRVGPDPDKPKYNTVLSWWVCDGASVGGSVAPTAAVTAAVTKAAEPSGTVAEDDDEEMVF